MSSGRYWSERGAWNFAIGCSPCSPACDNCWAASMAARWTAKEPRLQGVVKNGKWTGKVCILGDRLTLPERWRKPRVVAVNWLGDLFYEQTPEYAASSAFQIMQHNAEHQFLVLTKRSVRMTGFVLHEGVGMQRLPENIWWGATAWDQGSWDRVTEHLAQIPGNTWVSLEPQIGPVKPTHEQLEAVDWIVQGSQTGADAVEFDIDWLVKTTIMCAGNTPLWLKQTGNQPSSRRDICGREYNLAPGSIGRILEDAGETVEVWDE